MGNDVATLPQRYGAVRGAAAPFPAAPPSKWRPFYNFVILYLAKTMFCQVLCFHPKKIMSVVVIVVVVVVVVNKSSPGFEALPIIQFS